MISSGWSFDIGKAPTNVSIYALCRYSGEIIRTKWNGHYRCFPFFTNYDPPAWHPTTLPVEMLKREAGRVLDAALAASTIFKTTQTTGEKRDQK